MEIFKKKTIKKKILNHMYKQTDKIYLKLPVTVPLHHLAHV